MIFFGDFQWYRCYKMTVLCLYLVVLGVTDWAFSVWGSNYINSVDLCHFSCFTVMTSRTYHYTPRQKNLKQDCIGNEKRNWLAGWHMGGKARTALSIRPQQVLCGRAPALSLHPHSSKRLQNKKNKSDADIRHQGPQSWQYAAICNMFTFYPTS